MHYEQRSRLHLVVCLPEIPSSILDAVSGVLALNYGLWCFTCLIGRSPWDFLFCHQGNFGEMNAYRSSPKSLAATT